MLKIGLHIPAPGEIREILAAASPRTKPLLMVAAFTGLRSSELRGWCDVDLNNSELHVRQRADRYGVIGKPKSKAGYRTVPFGPLVQSIAGMEARLPERRAGACFPNTKRRRSAS